MGAAPPPLLGFNNNVRHRGRVFHIQTEDSGINHPRIVTHLFADGGRIVKTARIDYAEHVGRDDMAPVVRRLMKEQHKAMFVSLRGGDLDPLIERACGPAPEEAKSSEPRGAQPSDTGSSPVAVEAPEPPPSEVAAAPAPVEFEALAVAVAPPQSRPRPLSNPNLRRVVPPSDPGAPPAAPHEVAPSPKLDSHRPPPPPRGTPTFGTPMVAHPSSTNLRAVKLPDVALDAQAAGDVAAVTPAGAKTADQTGRYAASRPTTIFADAPKPTAHSIFGDGVSEKSLDEVILSYLAEDLDEKE